MHLRTALAASVSVAALLSTTLAATAQTDLNALYEAAKAEGQLTTIALPHTWCGYGELIEAFKAKYPGITVNELNPDAGSADELEAIRANKGNTGPQAPDVIDVGLSFGPASKEEGLIQPYKVSTWDSIPDDAKDPDGYWYGDYYGVLSFGINKDVQSSVPTSWADFMKPEFANSIAFAGDPRTSNNAIMSVYAAGLSTGAAPGEEAAKAGLEFFKKLNDAGNFVPVDAEASVLAQGTASVVMNWDYNLLAMRDGFAGNPEMEIVVPSDAVVAGVYIQAISAYAPHPNAAKLWMEYLYSDEGQLGWLKGYCHPIRFNDIAAKGGVPQELLDALPAADNYAKAVFPSLEDQGKAKAYIAANWDSVVGANVSK